MTDKETNGKYMWMASGLELQDTNWLSNGEPDISPGCVSLSGEGGLHTHECSSKQSTDGMTTRNPLCMQGLSHHRKGPR